MAEKLTQTAKNIAWTDHESSRPAEATKEQVAALQARLGYRFSNLWLLRLALVHSSAAPSTHNGILAWVGDAALYLVLSEEVGAKLGYVPIGQLRCALTRAWGSDGHGWWVGCTCAGGCRLGQAWRPRLQPRIRLGLYRCNRTLPKPCPAMQRGAQDADWARDVRAVCKPARPGRPPADGQELPQ